MLKWMAAIKSTIIYVKNKSYDEWKERFAVK
jgi:hypothetical protein